MRFYVSVASLATLSVGIFTAFFLTDMSAAAVAQPVDSPAGAVLPQIDALALPQDDGLSLPAPVEEPKSLAALVAAHLDSTNDADVDDETRCLATAVFYEARSESLAGQLAVARVIVNRARSGRFPASYCGVVAQRGQFSFVRGGVIPDAPTATAMWRRSLAVARIAHQDAWRSEAEGALFFHARRVSPGWGKAQLAAIDNHLFYR